jgi:excisionase family DNA binding protein
MDTPETFDDYLTPAEVARLLSVTPRTVSRWADQGRIAHTVTLGGHRRFLRSDIVKLLDQSRRSQGAPAR